MGVNCPCCLLIEEARGPKCPFHRSALDAGFCRKSMRFIRNPDGSAFFFMPKFLETCEEISFSKI